MILINLPAWTMATYFTVAITSVAIVLLARRTLFLKKPQIFEQKYSLTTGHPLTIIPYSQSGLTLPYPPNVLPGPRDVDSPYSIRRCYEWGPEEGRKVILVHGDTTPAPMLGPIAEKLVERACRVLFLCEWRGWGKRAKMVATFSLTNG